MRVIPNKTPILVTTVGSGPGGSSNVTIVGPNPLPVSEANIDKGFGTWAYYSGVSGTVTVTAGQRVIGIAAHSTLGGSYTINGGSAIVLPPGVAVMFNPMGNLTAPTIIFTSTDTYVIEVVS